MSSMMQLIGSRALIVNLAREVLRVKGNTRAAVAKRVLAVQKRAKSFVPRDTGALSRSIQAVLPGQRLVFYNPVTGQRQTTEQLKDLEGAVTVGMPYAAAVEFGTQFTRAQPYLQPALLGERNTHRDDVRKALGR